MNGIFSYSTRFKDEFQQHVSLLEGHTPMLAAGALARKLHMESLYLKDETRNPSGSFKDRATAYQLTYWTGKQKSNFVISSSGNAAISAAKYCITFGLHLDIFVSPNLPEPKQKRLAKEIRGHSISVHLHESLRPKHDAFQFARERGVVNLLHSKDDNAIEGYKTIGFEIMDALDGHCDDIFMPTSSASGLLGIGAGTEYTYPLFAVQTTKVHPIAGYFDTHFTPSDISLSNAISALVTDRQQEAIRRIEQTHGFGYAISDNEIQEAITDIQETMHLSVSPDSALSIAGLKKAMKEGKNIRNAICILTGK